jgi:RNA polymerase sigma-70 factor (ECF subfamily)
MASNDERIQTGVDSGGAGWFATTHWSVVLAAKDPSSPEARNAREELCRSYWYPLYAYLRRDGHSPPDAEDLTQEFLARLVAKGDLQSVEPRRGKFRSFLLGTLKHFLSDERKRVRAQKRGGGQTVLSFDAQAAEARYELEPVDTLTPEAIFERQWALTVLGRVMDRLRVRHERCGKAQLFAALEPCLGGSGSGVSYAAIGANLGLSEGSVKVAVHRLRKEFGDLLRTEIAGTVDSEAEIDEEIRQMIRVSGGL